MKINNFFAYALISILSMQMLNAQKADKPFKMRVFRSKTHKPSQATKYYTYFKGTYLHMSGQMKQAYDEFKKFNELHADGTTYDGFIRYLFDAQKFSELLELDDKVWEKYAHDIDVQLIRAKMLLQTNNDVKAAELFTRLVNDFPDNEQVIYFAIVFKAKLKKNNEALMLVNKAIENERLKQRHFLFYFLKSKLLYSLGRNQEALALAEKSVKLFPRFAKGWLFKGLLLEQMGKVNAAIAGYQRFLEVAGGDESVEKQLIHLLFSKGRFAEAANQLKRMKNKRPEYHFDLALIEWKAGNLEEALSAINKAFKKNNDFAKARLLKVEILVSLGDMTKLQRFMKEWLISSPEDKLGYQTLLLLSKTKLASKDVIELLKSTTKKTKKKTLGYLALSDMYLESDSYDEALGFYKKLTKLVSPGALRSKLYFQMGYIYYATDKKEMVEKVLQQAIGEKAVYPSAYNLLAYHYADTEKNLDKALDLANKALQINPTSHYYLDTKGYVLMKLGRKQEAIHHFKHALNHAPHDQVIANHLAQAKDVN